MKLSSLFLFLLCLICGAAVADQVTINLVDPTYQDGVFETHCGGVVSAPGIRIQAKHITYEHRVEDGKEISLLSADGSLMVIYGKRQFVGKKLEYDFTAREGMVYSGKVAIGAWFLGGKRIELKPEGRYRIHDGYLTTCEVKKADWQIKSPQIDIVAGEYVKAKNVSFRFFRTPVFWFPNYRARLKNLMDMPVQVQFKTGGAPGTRACFRYRVIDWKEWKLFLRLDFLLKRGLGGGIETDWNARDKKSYFGTRSFVARDHSIEDPKNRIRYRFHGLYKQDIDEKNITVRGTYDKLSDNEVATDYGNHSYDLPTAKRTYLTLAKQSEDWTCFFTTRVNINTSFQTINQELPSIDSSWRTQSLGDTGILSEQKVKAAYLYYIFADDIPNASNYQAFRMQTLNSLYRPLPFSGFIFTPRIGLSGIFYSNSPHGRCRANFYTQASGLLNCRLYRIFHEAKHVVEPYIEYTYITSPSNRFSDHYIFNIDDGLLNMNYFRFGLKNLLYVKDAPPCLPNCNFLYEKLSLDAYAYAFLHTSTIPVHLPRIYANCLYRPLPTLQCGLYSAWNFSSHSIDHANLSLGWTASEDYAFSLEFLHRSAYAWRKANPENFVMDLFRSQSELLESPISDRRNTLLGHLFCRVTPTWAFEFKTRYGFHRETNPNYFEWKIDLFTLMRCNWRFRFSFEHRVGHDNRFTMSFRLGGKDVGMKKQPPLW